MSYYIDLDENGVLVHNTLLLIPSDSTIVILRKLEKGAIGSMYFRTNYGDYNNQWKEMVLDESSVAFRYEFHVQASGAYFFATSFHPYDENEIEQEREGPVIRFVVQNTITIQNEKVGTSGLCIQSVLSSCIGSLSYFDRILFDSYLCGYNCIHVTPLQLVGPSGSCFSIHDFLDIHPRFIENTESISFACEQEFDSLLTTLHHISPEGKEHYRIVASHLSQFRQKYQMLFMTDIVLNHASFDNPLLVQYPEISYNNTNTPQLLPAIELDLVIQQVNEELEMESFIISSESDIELIINRITLKLQTIRFYEYWMVGLDVILHSLSSCFTIQSQSSTILLSDETLFDAFLHCFMEGNQGHRFPITINSQLLKETIQIEALCQHQIHRIIQQINSLIHQQVYQPIVTTLLTNLSNIIRYRFLQAKSGSSPSLHYPLVEWYFNNCTEATRRKRVDSYTSLIQSSISCCCYSANNGWTFDNCRDPLNLTVPQGYLFRNGIANACYSIHTKYLKREMVIWSDCVKLRYFTKEGEPTFIWDVMKEYIQLSAFLFDGFRLDNCHNTSLDLLQGMLVEGRKVNPHLIVMAELFTSNQDVDIDYISRLGLDMIVRETAQSASHYQNVKNYTDVLYQVGGDDLGSLVRITECPRHIVHTQLPTVLYDMTHDNRSFVELYGVASIPSVTVMLAMCTAHIASTKGIDEGYPSNPHVTTNQLYSLCNEPFLGELTSLQSTLLSGETTSLQSTPLSGETTSLQSTPLSDKLISLRTTLLSGTCPHPIQMTGNMYLRLLMNHLHQLLSKSQYSERYIHHYPDTSVVSIERRFTNSFYSVISITHTAFTSHEWREMDINVLGRVVGVFVSVTCQEELYIPSSSDTLTGLPFHVLVNTQSVDSFCQMEWDETRHETHLHLSKAFTPGASLVLLLYSGERESFTHFLNYQESCSIIQQTRERIASYPNHPYEICQQLETVLETQSGLSLPDLSYLLFTSTDEQVVWNGWQSYALNASSSICMRLNDLNHSYHQHHNQYATSQCVYAGFYGIIPTVRQIVRYNLLQHPLLENIRQGDWLMDYLLDRLNGHPSLHCLQELIAEEFAFIKGCPRNTRPVKFCRFMILFGILLEKQIAKRLGITKGNLSFALATLQFTTRLPHEPITLIPAGFPHFSTGLMRHWGRDTFLAAPGLLLYTRRYEELKQLLLDYGTLARHGLICNLRGDRKSPRYNSRDATWWWLYCLQLYCETTCDYSILKQEVEMEFPEHNPQTMTVERLVQWMMESLGKTIDFIEWNAPSIDEHMTEQGFHIQIGIDPETGFVHGGNPSNCGTWMDKMGSYDDGVHSNRGIPATPRVGAPIEMTALVAKTVSWLYSLYEKGLFSYRGIEVLGSPNFHDVTTHPKKEFWSYQQWYRRIKTSFEMNYFIAESPYGWYYKDCSNVHDKPADAQLRPNFIVAMSIAPSLFDKHHAMVALQTGIQHLYHGKHQLGVKTLSPHDPHYRCFYDNAYGYQGDLNVCGGWSYHNGPEWVWLVGPLVEAVLSFPPRWMLHRGIIKKSFLKQYCLELLQEQLQYIQEDDWMSLPEMTNHEGEYNHYACRAQAWSVGCCFAAYQKVLQL